jgi:hypothetical protein
LEPPFGIRKREYDPRNFIPQLAQLPVSLGDGYLLAFALAFLCPSIFSLRLSSFGAVDKTFAIVLHQTARKVKQSKKIVFTATKPKAQQDVSFSASRSFLPSHLVVSFSSKLPSSIRSLCCSNRRLSTLPLLLLPSQLLTRTREDVFWICFFRCGFGARSEVES